MTKLKFNHMLALASTMALMSGSQTVYAQTQPAATDVEEVVVTGYRAVLLNSLDVKRESDVIADVVDATALGSLPAVSIADALGRIPGVTTVRDSGQSSQLNIRGMNGDFIQTTLNGREQATTSSYTESLRWMSFDQYPAELITQAAVYKSPKASHIEGGVAAVVELKTANPLENKQEHTVNAGVRLSHNDAAADVGGDDQGERFNVSYQGKFLDDILGVAVGFSHLTQPNNFEGSRAGADGQLGYGNGAVLANAYQFQAGNGDDVRDGLLGSIVFQPNEMLKAQVDYFKSEFESEDYRHGVTIGGLSGASPEAEEDGSYTLLLPEPKTKNDTSPWFEARTEDQSTQADSESFGVNVEFTPNDTSTLIIDVTNSKGTKTRKDRLASLHAYEFGTATGDEPDGVDINGNGITGEDDITADTWQEYSMQAINILPNGTKTPTLTIGALDEDDNLFNPLTSSAMRLSRYEEYPHVYTDEVNSLKVDFKQDIDLFGVIKSFETGVRISKREFDSRRGTFLYGARDGQFQYVNGGEWASYCADNMVAPGTVGVDYPLSCEPQALRGYAEVGQVSGGPDHLVVDLGQLADHIFGRGNYSGKQVFSRDWTFVESGGLIEKTNAAYVMANLETEVSGIPVTGNVGVRVVRTDVKAVGVQNVGAGNGQPITDDLGVTQTNYDYLEYGPEYTDVLPSLNLNFAVTDNDQVRFSVAEVMGRPPAGQLKGGAGSWNGNGNVAEAYNVWTKGSPYLDPFRATQFDVSYEHYFENGGAVTVAGFYKDIESLVENISYSPVFTTVDGVTTSSTAEVFAANGLEIPEGMIAGQYNTAVNNDKGGYIRGIELAGTYTFDTLPGVFSGLGTTASYSFTESQMEVSGGNFSSKPLPIPGLSENVWSLTAFWDIGQFSTNLNVRYRDEFVVNMPIPGSSTPALNGEYTTVDYQASYDFDNGFDVVFEASNITDEPSTISYGVDSQLGEYKTFGRQYYVGVNYKF